MFRTEESQRRYIAAYDAVLAAWPVPFDTLQLPTRLGTTHVIASGPLDAPPLVLLHSLVASATVWRSNVAALSGHFRTYAVDVIGQGGKSVASGARIRGRRAFAGWLTDVLDGLGVQRASIVGCSFGGFLALSQASLTPERVDRVVLISPAGTFVGLSLKFMLTMLSLPLRRRLRRLMGDQREASMADLRMAPRDAQWAALMGVMMAERPRLQTISAAVLGTPELRAIRAPTLLLIGDQERLYDPQATLALAKRRMPALETAIVPGADHIAAVAQPEAVNARILEFLVRP
ncbi:alpha/beta hydrolase [uncultured Phenylobacterium sp.]|uniref:alpha/beta fold hydrolase n=1 Tax=uncultured Phenylobacterium sp. TaxID=349273 RepID=UPI0025DA7200|nr:alpha/beta hydrolase [uncultured Phenylobacterium sp.]